MPAGGPLTSPRVYATIIAALTVLVLSGCAQPLGVRVIDSSSGTPIAGARVTRLKVCCPLLWVVGPILPVEQCQTDERGLAHLKDREGSIRVEAAGFTSAHSDIGDQAAEEVAVSLERADNDAQLLRAPMN